jgi:16S rRNA (adenine1518-N6/adenine1519-N6)-dimethyltransferase
LKYFHQTVRALFFHRRKFLRSVVISALKDRLDKTEVDEVLAALGHDASQRAEQLTVEQIQKLVEALRLAEMEKGQA